LSDQTLVPELLQDQATATNLADALCEVLEPARQTQLREEFARIHRTLVGDLLADAADPIEALISSRNGFE